jgi:hypothetical protein
MTMKSHKPIDRKKKDIKKELEVEVESLGSLHTSSAYGLLPGRFGHQTLTMHKEN